MEAQAEYTCHALPVTHLQLIEPHEGKRNAYLLRGEGEPEETRDQPKQAAKEGRIGATCAAYRVDRMVATILWHAFL